MAMGAVRLTHTFIEELAPGPKRYAVCDSEARGLKLTVTPLGHKSFSWVGRSQGRVTRVTIGTYPEVALDEARRKAKRLVADAAEGKPVTRPSRRTTTGPTLGQAYDWWYEHHAQKHRAHPRMLADRFRRAFDDWRETPISDITPAMVEQRHTELGRSRGPVAANMAIGLLSQIVKSASAVGYRGDNPTSSIKRFAEHSRERFLQADEVPRFFAAINALQTQDARDFFLLCLWTGARKGNVAAMEYSEVSDTVWVIPAAKAKRRKPIRIPLVPQAVEIIERRRGTSRWVFPSDRSASGHYMAGQTAWRKIQEESGLKDIRIHDLRRTLGSWQAASGVSELIIGQSLGHTSPASTRIYARLHLDPVREAIEKATAAIEAASQKKSEKRSK